MLAVSNLPQFIMISNTVQYNFNSFSMTCSIKLFIDFIKQIIQFSLNACNIAFIKKDAALML